MAVTDPRQPADNATPLGTLQLEALTACCSADAVAEAESGARRLAGLRTEMAARHYVSMEQRLRMIQHQRAIDRYRKFLAWMPAPIVQDMPNFHIASYLGITPEVLSRVKQQLKTEGH